MLKISMPDLVCLDNQLHQYGVSVELLLLFPK